MKPFNFFYHHKFCSKKKVFRLIAFCHSVCVQFGYLEKARVEHFDFRLNFSLSFLSHAEWFVLIFMKHHYRLELIFVCKTEDD